ncbi:MAG TPA: hypothetical protein VGC41_04930 [Kofleriaceae bacterium]
MSEEPLADSDAPPLLDAPVALTTAIGAPSEKARQRAKTEPVSDEEPPRSRRTNMIVASAVAGGIGIAALIFLGHANAHRYAIACDSAHVVPQQGRSFPPWGMRPLTGAQWQPVTLPPNAECQARETGSIAELSQWYLEVLVDRATVTLTAKNLLDAPASAASVSALDGVSAQLDQALLLARDPSARDQRKELQRLQGDVQYWRAAARLREASGLLVDAAKQFEAANAQHPRHATDAAEWSAFLHRLDEQLRAGPSAALPVVPTATESRVPVPVGTALPVEPESVGSAPPPPDAPNANVPSGGVLL